MEREKECDRALEDPWGAVGVLIAPKVARRQDQCLCPIGRRRLNRRRSSLQRLYVASEVQDAGFELVIDAIDSVTLNETVEKAKSALEKNNLLSEFQVLSTSFVTITCVTDQN
jgi:hypothetical protein